MIAARERGPSLPVWTSAALAASFTATGFYTSLASLSPTPPVGYLFLNRAGAAILMSVIALGAAAGFAVAGRGAELLRSPILMPWIVALGVTSLAGFDPLSGLQVTAVAVLTGLLHLGMLHSGAAARSALFKTYLAAGALACAAAILMVLSHRPQELYVFNNGRAAGPFVTANQCAAFVLLYAGVAAGAVASMEGFWKNAAIGGLIAAIVTLYLTFSFGGWIAFAAGAAFLAFMADRRAGLIAVAVLAVLLAAAVPPALRHHNGGDTILRVGSWVAGLRVAGLFPLTGTGPMAFWEVYPAIAPIGADLPGQFGALHPHNVVLSLLDDLGIAGLTAVALGWAAFVREVRAALRVASPAARRLALSICAGLAASGAQGAVDLVGVVQLAFVWIPFTALALVAARYGPP